MAPPIKRGSGEILREILSRLSSDGVPHAVIHHADVLDSQLDSDIDIVLGEHPGIHLEQVLVELQRQAQLLIINRLHYEVPYGFYYILALPGSPATFLHLDITYDPIGTNHYLYTSQDLLSDRRTNAEGVWTVSPAKEATYLLIKKAHKGNINTETQQRISRLAAQAEADFHREWRKWWPTSCGSKIEKLLGTDSNNVWNTNLNALQHAPGYRLRFRGGYFGLRRILQETRRRLYRLTRPTGIFVAVMGPDGAGKSTVVESALTILQRGFRRTDHFHWRPGLLPKPSRVQNNQPQHTATDTPPAPPTQLRYGSAVSLLRYIYFLTDFIAGYWFRIHSARIRTSIVLGERWYYDIIINPVRYQFKLPNWLLRAGGRLIPRPDLVILLEADPDGIHERKPELTVDAIRKQLIQMHELLSGLENTAVVSTQGDVARSVDDFVSAILQRSAALTGIAPKT